jgi:hypothetical protein
LLAAWTYGLSTSVRNVLWCLENDAVGFDSHAYWLAGRAEHPYGAAPGSRDAFLYSPAFAQLLHPLALLPWVVFATLWAVAVIVAFLWLTAPLPWRWRVPVLLACAPEVLLGNVYAFMAVAAVLGLRRPQFWAFPLLTKITPGLLGLVWFTARGEWRNVARVLVATLVVTAISYFLDPGLWREWIQFLARTRADDSSMLLARFACAAGLVAVAARLDKAWLLPAAMWLAAPHFSSSPRDLTVLTGMARLWSWRRPSDRSGGQRRPDALPHARRGPGPGAPTLDREA